MGARVLSGSKLASTLREELRHDVMLFLAQHRHTPALAAVLVGHDPASEVYVNSKRKACDSVGLRSEVHRLPEQSTTSDLLLLVQRLNEDESVDGILVQLPLPSHMDSTRVLDAISPWKDVDGFHPENVGLLWQGRPRFLPCTPHGVQQLLTRNGISWSGQHVVIVGRSDIVGKSLAGILVQRDSAQGPSAANATVTICHRHTRHLSQITQSADVLVAAIGQPRFISADMVRPGAVVVDVGINREEGRLVGDVDFDGVSTIAEAISPVPGGVGPLTIAMLLRNTLHAAQLRRLGD